MLKLLGFKMFFQMRNMCILILFLKVLFSINVNGSLIFHSGMAL